MGTKAVKCWVSYLTGSITITALPTFDDVVMFMILTF